MLPRLNVFNYDSCVYFFFAFAGGGAFTPEGKEKTHPLLRRRGGAWVEKNESTIISDTVSRAKKIQLVGFFFYALLYLPIGGEAQQLLCKLKDPSFKPSNQAT